MQTHNLIQGTKEWLAHRSCFWNASDAPAMMGQSPYKTRTALLKELATGLGDDVSAEQQRLFDAGHRAEALARPLAEEIIGEELYPIVGSDGDLSASFDGLTLMYDVAFEHKLLNDSLRASIRQQGGNANEFLPPHYRIQMEQQCHVSGAERVLFMATKWDGDRLIEERHCWYTPDLELRAQILAGWDQFAVDLRDYKPEAAAEPAPVGKAPDTLPALRIEVTGAVTASNLAEFKQTALDAIRSVNRDLKTDADFADAAKAVKWCEDVEARLKAAKEHALSQTADIDALFKTLDDIGAEARAVRLDLDKLVKRRKDEVKEEAVMAARRALAQHVSALDAELSPIRLTLPAVDFAAAIKGLRSIASMQDALDTELANGKIAADSQARVIRANRDVMQKHDAHGLFPDFQQVCTKPTDDFANLLSSRRAAAQARLDAEREKIRAEEAARLEREARAKAEDEARQQRDCEAAAQREADAAAARARAEDQQHARAEALAAAPAPTPAPQVQPLRVARSAPVEESPTLSLGEIKTRIAPLSIDAAGLESLGFPATKIRAACMYLPSSWPAMRAAMIETLSNAALVAEAA